MESHQALALLIEASRYEEPTLPALPAAENDTAELAEVLRDPVIGGYRVQMLKSPASREAMDAIHDFMTGAQEDAKILLHLACHAVRDSKSNVYLAVRDTDLKSVRETAIPVSDLINSVRMSRATYVVVILDLCHAGTLYGKRESNAIERQQSHVALFASSYGYDQASTGHSPFTRALVRCLRDPTADLNGDGVLDLRELHLYVGRNVRSKAKQIVLVTSGDPASNFLIAASGQRTTPNAEEGDATAIVVFREDQAVRSAVEMPYQPNSSPPQSPGDESTTVSSGSARWRSLWYSFVDGIASAFDPLGAASDYKADRRILGWPRIKTDLSMRYSRLSRSPRRTDEAGSEDLHPEPKGGK